MEKIVTKIGDVTIERRVPKTPLQNFTLDPAVLSQNESRTRLDDLSKSYSQSDVLKNQLVSPILNAGLPNAEKNFDRIAPVGNLMDSQPEMERRMALPKGLSWDYKSSDPSQHKAGNMNENMNPSEFSNNSSQSQKRSDEDQFDISRFGGISTERKRARVPEKEVVMPFMGRYDERHWNSFFPGKEMTSQTEYYNPVKEQNKFVKGDGTPRLDFPQVQGLPDSKNFPVERLAHGGLTIEKRSSNQENLPRHSFNTNTTVPRFQNLPFLPKSLVNKPDVDYDVKEIDLEESFENESDYEVDEEDDLDESVPYTNSEPGMDLTTSKPVDEGVIPFSGPAKNFGRSGSPIVLSSEDDDKNDDDVELVDHSNLEKLTNLNPLQGNLAQDTNNESIVIDDSSEKNTSKFSMSTPKVKSKFDGDSSGENNESERKTVSSLGEDVTDKKPDLELDSDDLKELQDLSEVDNTSSELGEDDVIKISDGGATDLDDGNKVDVEHDSSEEDDDDAKDEKDNDNIVKLENEDEDPELKSSETELPASDGSEEVDDKPSKDGCKSDVDDIVCDDLVELMKKGEIEGEVEDEKSDETDEEEEGEDKKGGSKRKADGEAEGEKKTKRKKKKSEKTEEGESKEDGDKNIDKSKVTSANLRKNIREVMDETKLDEATLSAQRQEAERLKRLQDQQRIIRDLQKQIVLNRQGQKTQSRVLSLLQRNSQTSILKTSSAATPQPTAQSNNTNHVLVKLSNGQQTSLNNKKMIELLKNSKNKVTVTKPSIPKTLLKQGMVSPSVSIAPVAKKEVPEDDKKKKKGDVVTLSSDSEDDCIVLSDEDESEPEEDPTNSGMHTSDKYNVPDDKGRVVVNVGHPEAESDIFLAPQIARIIKPHQIGGIRFLYDNVIESVERFQSSTGFGCILAHSMGLGKTLQIVSFSDIFLRYTSAKTILCIMPINTIQNWLAEFNMWLPKENNSGLEVRCRDFDLYIVNESLKNINARSKVILDWHRNGGVLLMGYELFRLLSLKKSYKSKKKKKKEMEEKEDEAKNKELMEEVYGALVRPGPDLVICDEGHRIKNSHATTSQALKQIRTKRRIVLTGYPLQNNLLEYWCMVDFVRPNYLGSRTEFSNMFERPIQNGQCIDSTPQDKRLMRYRAHVLHSLLEGFVQRRSHAVLQSTLPEKEEYVLLLRFTPFQRKLYDTFMNEVVRTVAVPNPLKAFAVCCKIWNHPDVLYNFLKKKGEEIDLDLEEALAPPLQPFGQTPSDGVGQFPSSSMVPMWPRRGPGSRGGKVRQCAMSRRPGRGRKPAATVSPSQAVLTDKKEDPEGFSTGAYPGNYPDFANRLTAHNSSESSMEGDRANRGFGARSFNQYPSSEYGNHSNFTGPGYDSKNPLENLEDMSSGDFQSKQYYPQQGEAGMPNNYPNAPCMQPNSNYHQSNNSDLGNSFSSNLNRNNSTFNQGDASKPFQYNQDYNSEYYAGGNFRPPHSNPDFELSGKGNFSRTNPPPSDSNSYYQNPRYGERDGGMGYNMQSTTNNMDSNYQGFNSRNPDANFQQGSLAKHYQGTKPGYNESACNNSSALNYQNTIMESQRKGDIMSRGSYSENSRLSDANYPRGDFQSGNFSNSNFSTERDPNSGANFQGTNTNFNRSSYGQDYWPGANWPPCNFDSNKNSGDANNEFIRGDSYSYEGSDKKDGKKFASDDMERKQSFGVRVKSEAELDGGFGRFEDDKSGGKLKEEDVQNKKDEEFKTEKKEEFKCPDVSTKKEDGLPYDWATDLFKNYVTGIIENSSKMEVFFHILTESINIGDRLLVFSQSLLTLDLIEDYLHRRNVPNKEEKWAKNRNYFRLDGSTPGLEREKLINEFNSNPNVFIFLVSTRAGSLGINLVGANRVVVFDASWNPCHDTQAVCRVYRYGQQKPCFVYRLVMDSCLEKKIYDRQINKQGMADRVVDELNPDAHLSIKEVTNLCWDDQEDTTVKDFSYLKDKFNDQIIKILLENCSKLLSKEPFQHESLLIDRKEKKLSQAEKRLAKRSYELEKQAANQPKNVYSFFPSSGGPRNFGKPIASVRPMQNEMAARVPPIQNRSKWIPAEVWQKQGMSAQEMTLPLDVVIPTNTPEKTSIVLKAGQRVMVLKSPKGIYMQLENGKIIAIRTAFKVGQGGPGAQSKADEPKKDIPVSVSASLKNNPNLTVTSKPANSKILNPKPSFIRPPEKKLSVNLTAARPKPILEKTKPLLLNRKFQSVTPEIKQRLLSSKAKFEAKDKLPSDAKNDVIVTKDTNEISKYDGFTPPQDSTSDPRIPEERNREGQEQSTSKELDPSLDSLRKVTENIREKSDGDDPQVQMNLKNYRHNFSSQLKSKTQDSNEEKVMTGEVDGTKIGEESSTFSGNENVQNWLMNQTYPPVDPYGNYFPSYYGYGHGPGSMVNPYEGLYPNNYMGQSGNGKDSQAENSKTAPYQQNRPQANAQQITRSNPTSASYPPYSNPYQYSYNYPSNQDFNNQTYFPQSQNNQQLPTASNSGDTNHSNSAQNQPYDNSMYSAFHRPEGHFQGSDNSYPVPYRPPYPNNAPPGFFPYNSPYRPYADPNYHYSSNFNPYMHPSGYGYPMQNPPHMNNNNNSSSSFNQHSTESAANAS